MGAVAARRTVGVILRVWGAPLLGATYLLGLIQAGGGDYWMGVLLAFFVGLALGRGERSAPRRRRADAVEGEEDGS